MKLTFPKPLEGTLIGRILDLKGKNYLLQNIILTSTHQTLIPITLNNPVNQVGLHLKENTQANHGLICFGVMVSGKMIGMFTSVYGILHPLSFIWTDKPLRNTGNMNIR